MAWNELPNEIKCSTCTFLFKKVVKLFLFDNLNGLNGLKVLTFLSNLVIYFSSYISVIFLLRTTMEISVFHFLVLFLCFSVERMSAMNFCIINYWCIFLYLSNMFCVCVGFCIFSWGPQWKQVFFTSLCYSGTLMYLCVLVLLCIYVVTLVYKINQIKFKKIAGSKKEGKFWNLNLISAVRLLLRNLCTDFLV